MSWPTTVALLVLLAVAACSDDEPTGATRDGQQDGIPVTLVDQPGGDTAVIDPFTLLAAEIDGDTLRMQVGYSGGCRAHAFELAISGDFMESEPAQTTAVLRHDSDDDPCEAFILTWLEADLVPLRQSWQASYQGEHGTIVLHLGVPASEAECDTTPFDEPGGCSLLYSF